MVTPLEEARNKVDILRECGISPTLPHCHVGENGTRCEFCGRPVEAFRHHPNAYLSGSTTYRGNQDW